MKNIRTMQLAIAVIVLTVAALVVAVLTLDGSEENDLGSTGGGSSDAPEFVDAFGPEAPGTNNGEPVDRASCERQERISWTEAERYVNQKVAIIGAVTEVETGEDGATLTIGRTEDEIPVTVHITEGALNRLPENPEKMYGDDAVCVVGVLQAVGTQIQVVVNEPTDISVF